MTAALTAIGEVITFLLGKFGDLLGMITTQPVLLIPFSIFVLGALIGLTSRLQRSF